MLRWKTLVTTLGVGLALIPVSRAMAADSSRVLSVKVLSVAPGPQLPHVDVHGMTAPNIPTEQVVFAVTGPSSTGFKCTGILHHDHKLVGRGAMGGRRGPQASIFVQLPGRAKPFNGPPSDALVRCVTAHF
jgi:hypothetical protein